MNPAVAALLGAWRDRATELTRLGIEQPARVVLALAVELEEALRADQDALLTVKEAAVESGTPERTLRDQLKRGALQQANETGPALIRRADLEGRRRKSTGGSGYDAAADAAGIMSRMK